jgi:uncharacterized protein (DUF488 family)
MQMNSIYTIGHSTHELTYFLKLLQMHLVNCLVDVRSVAASNYNPQYNKDTLAGFLKNYGITYLHFAKEFGARQTAKELLDDTGQLDFEKVRHATHFKQGIERLKQGTAKGYTIALMCAEGEPLDCHRFGMVSTALVRDGIGVLHIMKDGSVKTHEDLEKELIKKYERKLPQPDIFTPNIALQEQLKVAYKLQNKDIAYAPGELD